MTDPTDIQTKLKAWFAQNFERESFRMSMGEIGLPNGSMKLTMSFLAHGVAFLGAQDPGYMFQLVKVHRQLIKMCSELEKYPKGKLDIAYQYAMMVGVIIEFAAQAVHDLEKE